MAGLRALPALAVLVAFGLMSARADAGGIAVGEHGRGLGNANAGGAAAAEDATTIWWNPAGLTRIRRSQFVGAGYYAMPTTDSNVTATTALMTPIPGATNVDGGENVLVPSLFAAFSLSHRLKLGLGVNAPYALVTDYGDAWAGRYYADRSEISTININPSIAYRVNRCWSVGAGVSYQYADALLSNAIDTSTIAMAPYDPANDSFATIDGDDWSFGFNVGVLWEPTCRTRVGLHYRSQIEHTLEGDADFDRSALGDVVNGGTGLLADTTGSVDLTLPDTLSVSGYHEINRCWAVMADVTWTDWSDFDRATIEFGNPAQPDQVLNFDWEDTWRFSVGATWTPNRVWSFRAGLAYDQSPIPDHTRTPRIPGDDRIWVTLGVGYRVSRCVSLDLSYAHIFLADGKIQQTVAGNPANVTRGNLVGENETGIDIIGLQLTVDF